MNKPLQDRCWHCGHGTGDAYQTEVEHVLEHALFLVWQCIRCDRVLAIREVVE